MRLIFAFLFCGLPSVALGETHWVSATGAAPWPACAGGTPIAGASACALSTANVNADAGDTVVLRAGEYVGATIQPEKTGTSDSARIVFTSHVDEEVLIRDSAYGILIYKKSYITVDGIDFYRLRRFFRIYGGHYNTISHCNFDQRSSDSGDWAGAIIADDHADDTPSSEDSTHNWVHHCTFYRFVYGDWDENRGSLLDIGNNMSAGDDSSYNLIEDNVFAYGGHHTLGVYSHFNVIRRNYIHNETDPESWAFSGYRGSITEGPNAGWTLYEGNRWGFSDASGLALRSPHNIIRRNELYNNGSGAIQFVSTAAPSDSNYVYNNSFFKNGFIQTYAPFQCGMFFADWGTASPADNVIKNNIYFGNNNGPICYDGAISTQVVENNWEQNATDPGFVDLSGTDPHDSLLPDLHLVTTSDARDQGTWLTAITSEDGTGASFDVQDSHYFMDGWSVIQGDLIQLQGQTQTARVTEVDYANHTVTVDRDLTFTTGQGVALAYADAAPDLGAFEIAAATMDDGPPSDGEPASDGAAPDGGAIAQGDGSGGDPVDPGLSGGCGCRSGPGGSELLLLVGLIALTRRRRV